MALWLLSWAMFSKRNVWARPPKEVEANEAPGTGPERVESNPTAQQHCQTHGYFDPHRAVGFGGNVLVGKESIEALAQDFGEGGNA